MTESESAVLAVVLCSLWAFGYMIPTMVAFFRGHRQRWPILVVNLLLGWTLIVWGVVLAWALWRYDEAKT